MAYTDIDLRRIKHQMTIVYQELNKLRNQIEILEHSKKDPYAFEKLEAAGEKIRKSIGRKASTKEIIDDIRE